MSMKWSDCTFFVSAFVVLILLYIPSIFLRCLLFIILCIWLCSLKEYLSIFIVVLCVIRFCISLFSYSFPYVFEGRVVDVSNASFVVSYRFHKVLVYSDVDISLDDIVIVEGECQKVVSTNNRVGFSYALWMKSKGIDGVIYNDNIQVKERGNSLRWWLKERLKEDTEVNRIMNMFLFHDYEDEVEWIYLGLSLGFHLRFLLQIVRNLCSFWLYDKQVKKIGCLMSLLLCFFYYFDFITVRLLIQNIVRCTSLSKKNRWGCMTLICLFLFPNTVYSLMFVLPIVISFVYSFSDRKSICTHDFIYLWIQLLFNGYVSIAQLLFSKCIRYLFSLMYVICILNIFLPLSILIEWFINWLNSMKNISIYAVNIIGKPSMFLTLIGLIMIIRYAKHPTFYKFICILGLFITNYVQYDLYPFARVVYIDVGQGDCTLVSLPFSKGNFLIDTGGSYTYDIGKNIVYPVLSSYGINKLDAIILTHEDNDHSGAMESLKEFVDIERVIKEKSWRYNINEFEMFDGLYNYQFDGDNENSLTVCFSIFKSYFLFLGDITKIQEEIFVSIYNDLKIDYLHLAHHGSNSSTSNRLLISTQPKYAIISCGSNNYYNHPSSEVIERLDDYHIPYVATKDVGAIEIIVTPFFDCMITQNQWMIMNYKVRF